ncbi:hypothetical protein DF030_26970 [Burkholderia cenocepacia]|nr:hypothetical protein DF030_26970 [Burkholderia cenocepacia]
MRRATNSRWFFAARRIRSRNVARHAIADEARPRTTAGETRHRARRTGNRCGQVVAARVAAAGSGYPRLDAAARDAVLASRCAAYVENGTPTPMRARVPITFNLDERPGTLPRLPVIRLRLQILQPLNHDQQRAPVLVRAVPRVDDRVAQQVVVSAARRLGIDTIETA